MNKSDIKEMLELQYQLNVNTIGQHWDLQEHPWYRAVWTEAAELLEELNWKWWKHGEINNEKVHMELVDIWHFLLSWLIELHEGDIETCCNVIYRDHQSKSGDYYDNLFAADSVESFVSIALEDDYIPINEFFVLCQCLNLNDDLLFNLYKGKNILNKFRQDNGYKDGSYKKTWYNGKSDTEVLYEICKRNYTDIYKELTSRYTV